MKQEILDMHTKEPSLSYKEIARRLQCNYSTVRYHLNSDYRQSHLAYRLARRKDKKKQLVKEFGGKCSQCGYSKSMRALTFHHLDPKVKDLDLNNSMDMDLDRIREELAKCILVCFNCHMEIHETLDATKE